MRNCKSIVRINVCIVFLVCLFGCAPQNEQSSISSVNVMDSSSTASVISETDASLDQTVKIPKQDTSNMVDERFELLSLVFRLAGREEYGDVRTEYQQRLVSAFSSFKEHDAVQYAVDLPLGYDAVFMFSVHIQKDGEQFVLIDDIGSLVEDGRWTQQSAAAFLKLLNDFYTDTGFAAFYQSNLDFYKAETKRFMNNTYSEIDLAWFSTFVDPENLRCVYSPSSSRNNYSATVNDAVVYCAVSGDGVPIIHEYCHSFANQIAQKWYEDNPEFQKWCNDTIDPAKLPNYGNGLTIAGEYVTRAYNTLYYAQHGYMVSPLLYAEKGQGFTYIEEVYGMIAPYEKPDVGDDKIKNILGVSYEMGQEKSISIGARTLRWKVLTLSEPLLNLFAPTEVGNAFGSNTNDVLYVEDTGEKSPYLLIDLGDSTFQEEAGYRLYSRIPIE